MAKQTINIGTAANDGTGDPLRTSFDKANDNFDEIYLAGPVGTNIRIQSNTIISTDENGNITLDPNGTGAVIVNSDLIVSGSIRGDSSSLLQFESEAEFQNDVKFNSFVGLATQPTAIRDALTPSNGDIFYNTSTHKFQGYANGSWVDLH